MIKFSCSPGKDIEARKPWIDLHGTQKPFRLEDKHAPADQEGTLGSRFLNEPEFVEALIRIALEKFRTLAGTEADKLQHLLRIHVFPNSFHNRAFLVRYRLR